MQDIELSVITVNYNGLDDTCEMIDTIPFNERLEVIVVDNGSAADEASVISRRYPQVRTLRSERNLGFAGGNNLGLHIARGRYLYFINNDTLLHSADSSREQAWKGLQAMMDRLATAPEVAVVCPKIRFAWSDRPLQFAGYTPLTAITLRNRAIGYAESDHGQYDTPHPTPYAHGAAMMVSRDAVSRVGPMPECYFLYYEELDWSLSFTRAGYQLWYDPRATVYHKESRTTGADSPLKTYYITRNRLLFARRNLRGPRRQCALAYQLLVSVPRHLLGHLWHGHRAQAGAVWHGVLDFYRQTDRYNAS